jgi:ABC-2 type transport system ATP-binding protein
VEDVSFSLYQGEVLGFLGPNGAGKSTTLAMLAGTLTPTTGRITIDGVDLAEQPEKAKTKLGYLPETLPLYPELTVDEHLQLAARLHRMPRELMHTALEKTKNRCNLQNMGQRLIGNLSKGFRQRLGLAQAIIHDPAVILLDEPTSGLDPLQMREIRTLIRDLVDGHSVILSSHYLNEAETLCDRVQIMHQGRIIFCDSITSLQQQRENPSLLLSLHHPPPDEDLLNVPGVAAVHALDDHRREIRFTPTHDPSEALAKTAAERNWGLYELHARSNALEEIFTQLTREP